MRLWDRVLARADLAHENLLSGAVYVATTDASGRSKEGSDAALIRTARQAYTRNGVVFACALVRQSLFSEAAFCFKSAIDGHLFTDQDLTLLQHPFPGGTEGELLARMDQDLTTAGNSYWRKVTPADGSDDLLVQMRPDTVTIVSEESRDNKGRTYKRPVGYLEDVRAVGVERDPQMYTTDEVAHYTPPTLDPGGQWRGMSWLTPARWDIGADLALTDYKTAHLQNGAFPGLAVKYSQKLSDKTVETLRRRLSAKYSGAENSGKVLVLDEGADPQVMGSTLEQLQYAAVSKAGEMRICAAAGPGMDVILGFEQGDYQAAMRKLADLWARPAWRMACAALEHLVPLSANVGPVKLWYDVEGIAALREGELQRAQAYLVKSQGLAATVVAGFTRESAVQAAESGDISLLKPDPGAPPAGISGRQTETEKLTAAPGQRPPQAGKAENLPGVGHPNVPNARPGQFAPMPAVPGGPRGDGVNGRRGA